MTYKLNPIIEKIESPVVIHLPNGEQKKYSSGSAACKDSFDKNYQIKAIRADGSTVIIEMVENDVPATTWLGEEQSFF